MCLIGKTQLLCMQCRGIGPHLVARGKSHGFSRVAAGTWGIFSSYDGDACYLTHDTDIDKILFASVGDNITYKNIPLKDYVEYLEDPVSIVEQFSSVIDSILKTVPVNKVYISGNLFTHMDSLTALISENFTSLDIEFKHINYKNYIQYVAKLLRDSISEAIISNYLSK